MDFAQGLCSAQDRGSSENGHRDEDVAERQAAVVKEVHELDRENGAEEGRMGQGCRAQGLGQGAEVCAEETEPLLQVYLVAAANRGIAGSARDLQRPRG